MIQSINNKVLGKIIDINKHKHVFCLYTQKFNHRNEMVYTFIHTKILEFLKDKGFRLYKGDSIQIKNMIACYVGPEDIFKYLLEYVRSEKNDLLENAFLKQGETLLLKNKSILLSLSECEIPTLYDTSQISFKTYRNGVIKVEDGKEFVFIPYDKLDGLVFENKIIQRDFVILNQDQIESSMFAQFVRNITVDDDHFHSLCTAIGYLLHTHKNQTTPYCIIINDENLIDEGKPEGGTGKGLLVKGISQIVEKAMYNGKSSGSNFTDKFGYQNVRNSTNIIFIDDAPRNFDFEALFSSLTDDLVVERKYQDVLTIPFESSPKFVITTNYTIKGDSSSYKRRRFDTFLNNTYSDTNTPFKDFHCEFFNGWNENQWIEFDFFMMACLRKFLSEGLLFYDNDNLKLKMLKNETSSEFYELMENSFSSLNEVYDYGSIRFSLINTYGSKYDFHNKHTKKTTDWVDRYADYKGFEVNKKRAANGINFSFSK